MVSNRYCFSTLYFYIKFTICNIWFQYNFAEHPGTSPCTMSPPDSAKRLSTPIIPRVIIWYSPILSTPASSEARYRSHNFFIEVGKIRTILLPWRRINGTTARSVTFSLSSFTMRWTEIRLCLNFYLWWKKKYTPFGQCIFFISGYSMNSSPIWSCFITIPTGYYIIFLLCFYIQTVNSFPFFQRKPCPILMYGFIYRYYKRAVISHSPSLEALSFIWSSSW